MGETASQATRQIACVASLHVDPDRLKQLWAMTPDQRRDAAQRGRVTLGEMLRWASRAPHEVPLVNGEFFFITALSADSSSSRG